MNWFFLRKVLVRDWYEVPVNENFKVCGIPVFFLMAKKRDNCEWETYLVIINSVTVNFHKKLDTGHFFILYVLTSK